MVFVNLIVKIFNLLFKTVNIFYFQLPFYIILGLFKTRKFKEAKKLHKYAVMVAARNEEAVIGNLLKSIKSQNYPSELITVFVVADNCTDNTAKIVREQGAVCYERFDTKKCTKGYALQFLVEQIKKDYGIFSFDGYFVFDADNLLKEDYITRMNESFDAGEKIVTSYRSSKNFDDNWISASYALHWLRTARTEHRARSVLRLASRVQGTGFLFASEIIKNGWNYVRLTEDRSFCADAVVNGYRISYNNEAIFYDEQPTDIKIEMRQRIRWAKGNLQSFTESGGKLFWHILRGRKGPSDKSKSRWTRFKESLKYRFMSFDMLTVTFPYPLLSFVRKLVVDIMAVITLINVGFINDVGFVSKITQSVMDIFGVSPFIEKTAIGFIFLFAVMLAEFVITWFCSMCIAVFVFITERKRIKPIKWYKKIFYCLCFPFFDIIGEISMCIALFSKVEWKPIPHNSQVKIEELEKAEEKTYLAK